MKQTRNDTTPLTPITNQFTKHGQNDLKIVFCQLLQLITDESGQSRRKPVK